MSSCPGLRWRCRLPTDTLLSSESAEAFMPLKSHLIGIVTMLWEAKIYRRIPKTRHCFCIHDNVYLDYSLFPFTWWSFFGKFWLTRALDRKYDNLYSNVGSKPLLGFFTRKFIVSAISNARDYRSSTVSTAFWKQEGFGFRISCRKIVPSTWTSDLKGPIAHFSLGSRHEIIRPVAVIWCCLPNKVVRCC